MPIEENRAVARRVLDDLVSQGRVELVEQIYAQAFEFRDPTAGQTITTHEGMRDLTRDVRARTPDIAVLIEEEIAEGDAVVHRWTASGHHAETGRFWSAPGISIYHFQKGRIVSEYVVFDRLSLLRQLGMAPVPGQPPALGVRAGRVLRLAARRPELLITPTSYALRECSHALLVDSEPALASCSQGAAGGDRWLLTAVRGHLGDTGPSSPAASDISDPSSEAHTTSVPAASGICPVTARTVQGMAPYPGQARCLALGFWPECFRRLNVTGGRRPFPEETRSALDIEGKHVTIQGPFPAVSPATITESSARMRMNG